MGLCRCRIARNELEPSNLQTQLQSALLPLTICAVRLRDSSPLRKPTCRCAKPNDPGHDPQIRLTVGRRRMVADGFLLSLAWQAQAEIGIFLAGFVRN